MPPVAAADAGKAHKNSSSAHSSPIMKNSNESSNATKLCHIVKRADFDGYGFNLHSEKSKPGQYIGKIDANSPAEAAGLMEGDRILEVNGLPIGNETHKQVVQRIKAIAWEVKLLVTREPIIENNNKSASINSSNNSTSIKEKKIKNDQTTATTNNGATNNAVSVINSNNASSPTKNNGSSVQCPMTPTTPPPPFTEPSSSKISSDGNSTAGGTLKLPSTAAEMRAILQSKKKYNPKSDDVNLQKKYDIIQKL